MATLIILSRWLHLISAVLAIGGLFFMRVILPLGLAQADATSRDAVFLRCRRVFKITIHACVLFLLLTGAFNTWANWGDYKLNTKLMHGLWGPHMLLGIIAMILAFVLLGPKQPPKWHRTGALINFILLLVVVFLASTLKYVRDSEMRRRANAATPPPATIDLRTDGR